jgi:CheY-like chemotaxis protein
MSEFDRAALLGALPYARRFARALTGSQASGDAIVAEALRAGATPVPGPDGARLGLFASVARVAGAQPEEPGSSVSRTERMMLLLTSLEELDVATAAAVLGIDEDLAEAMVGAARDRLRAAAAARILIIEDEAIIAMDLQQLVASEEAAVAIAERERPSLVLADVNLGHGGDGANAVERILARHSAPVIFVTAYPERLLTGSRVEPAFVITKPFEPTTLAVATYQAVTRGLPLGAG